MLLNPYRFGGGGGGDPYFSSVKSLMHLDGTNGSTTFTDVIGTSWSANGSAQISTAQSVFGGASLLCDGTSDSIVSASGADLGFGNTEDFTLEFRIRFNGGLGVTSYPLGFASGNAGIQMTTGSKMVFFTLSGSRTSTTTFTTGVWYAIAVTREATTTRLFVDGVIEDSAAGTSGSSGGLPGAIALGGVPVNGTAGLNGWLDEFRFTKGVARYTANYTPAVSAFPDS